MTDEPQPDFEEAPGWFVTDPDGNVVDSGPISHGILVTSASETVDSGEGDE